MPQLITPLSWNFWPWLVVLAIMATGYMADGVYRLRTRGKHWKNIVKCAAVVAVCIASSVGYFIVYQSSERLIQTIKNRPQMDPLPVDWGSNFTPEERTHYSEMLAGIEYREKGIIRNYIDQSGALRPYEPTEVAQQGRIAFLRYMELQERASVAFLWIALLWLLLPVLGLGLAYLKWWERVVENYDRRVQRARKNGG